MTLLLDTHAFLWFCMEPIKLGASARRSIRADGSEVFVSAVSFWARATSQRLIADKATEDSAPRTLRAISDNTV